MKTTVKINHDAWDEYRVPAPDGTEAGAYYTDDKEDAVGTARHMYKSFGTVEIKFTHYCEHTHDETYFHSHGLHP